MTWTLVVRSLGADAVGYTMYFGSPRQDEDFMQLRKVRQD